ncbi:hypothetical protein AB7W95_17415 [Providencia rettgeri]
MSITPEFDADLELEEIHDNRAFGKVYSDKKRRFPNGYKIYTSEILNIDTYLTDGYIKTVNSVYRIIV